ncbi:LacI family DNA-binding transcriptional regulator [Prosthecodimorpha staleyi]|uniref:LacI family transcriptional regulator n=1 Tax=Prosthecodimorpha staleyi TaxID=2840188 RepID=A0A947D8D5_9HYPH|nr:LacI family DNA-binding transcriptional regulator [Prosthecodimorpha staleyi]MBT9292995.1 LacI family transcriptional regulator [Prosthecodimorpha staleyi]
MKQPVKMKDLAEALGLSVSTVARALADSPRISRETRERVAAAAERQGYVVDRAAQAMRTGTSAMVGLLVPDIQNDLYSTAAKAIARCCRERGVQLVLAVTDDDAALELHHLRNLRSARAIGVIMIPSIAPRPETLKLMRSMDHIQFVRHCPAVSSDWFGIEDVEAMRLAAGHLIAQGHRRIAYIGSTVAISTGELRLAGFRRTLQEAGIAVDEALIHAGSCDSEFGRAAMDRLLAADRPPSAVVTAGARISIGAYDSVRRHGVSVPRDLSFVGFGDSPTLRWCGDGITTIALPVEDLATASTDFLFRMATREGQDRETRCKFMLRPTLIERGSTAAPSLVPAVEMAG